MYLVHHTLWSSEDHTHTSPQLFTSQRCTPTVHRSKELQDPESNPVTYSPAVVQHRSTHKSGKVSPDCGYTSISFPSLRAQETAKKITLDLSCTTLAFIWPQSCHLTGRHDSYIFRSFVLTSLPPPFWNSIPLESIGHRQLFLRSDTRAH